MVFQVMLILFLNAFLKYKLVEWLESADPWLSGWKPKVWHLLVLQMALLKILCFERSYFLQGENLRSCIGQRRHLWTVSLHGGVSFREPFCIQVLFLAVVYGLLLRGVDCYGAFYFLFLFFTCFVHSDVFVTFVGAEVGRNWYLLYINIFPT
jgi:hypothetical protein